MCNLYYSKVDLEKKHTESFILDLPEYRNTASGE